ncbi:MAG: site-specific integrase [Gammaproteobacteria bacterium]|nr:site-specific integrase [Gammaproteobacteria bacterium]
MARRPRDARLETRSARRTLAAQSVPHWKHVHPGLAIGYYKGRAESPGAWYLRRARQPGEAGTARWKVSKLGIADDFADADGVAVLSYGQAVTAGMGRTLRAGDAKPRTVAARAVAEDTYTVKECIDDYRAALKARKGEMHKVYTFAKHVLPAFGTRPVIGLETQELQIWHDRLARKLKPGTAKRVWTDFRSALNQAFANQKVPTDAAWRRVKVSRNADVARFSSLTAKQAQRFLNSCDAEFQPIARAALLTGARWGELCALQVQDFNPEAGTVHFVDKTKSGADKQVPLTAEGAAWFKRWAAGKKGSERIFTHADGREWKQSHQIRRTRAAAMRAKLDPAPTFHDLRRTYGSLLAQKGVPLKYIAQALGHTDTRMAEKHYAHLQKSNEVAKAIRRNLPRFGKVKTNVVSL